MDRLLDEQSAAVRRVISDPKLDAASRAAQTQAVTAKYAAQIEAVSSAVDEEKARREASAVGKVAAAAAVAAVPLRVYGGASQKLREVLELFDTFCSRYFVAVTVFYVIVKTLHYVVFPTALDGLDFHAVPDLPAALRSVPSALK